MCVQSCDFNFTISSIIYRNDFHKNVYSGNECLNLYNSTYQSRIRVPKQFALDTESKSSKPVDAHGQRPLVPRFTGVQDEHFKAYVERNFPRRALSSTATQRLSGSVTMVSFSITP